MGKPSKMIKHIKLNSVCLLTSIHLAYDIRIFHKQAKTLIQIGHKVTLIAQHNNNEIINGINIISLPKPKNRFIRIFGLTWRTLFLALGQRADIYHFHDPELIFIGILLKILRKKVVYDVHEDVPKQIMDKGWLGNNQIRKIASFIMNIVEQIGARSFNKIIVVTPEIAKRFPENKVVILRNFPVLKLIDDTIPVDYKKKKPIIIYAGGLTKIRGIKEIIQAMEYIGNKAGLWLLGQWESEKFKEECEELKGWNNTKYLGFKNLQEVYGFMKSSDIGILNFLPVENHLKALPNKCFEYMACSLPMVISNFPYWKDIFGECALFANPHKPKDIAQKILLLLENINLMTKMGKNGRKLVVEEFSWEEETKKLLEMYEHLS